MNETLNRGEKWQGELINKRKDGTLVYEKASIIPIFMDGELVQYLAIKLDVTDYIQQQKILQQAATVYESISDTILITDEKKKIVSVNPAFSNMFSYGEEEVLGKEPMIIMSLREDTAFYRNMWHRFLSDGRWSGRVKNRAKDGRIIPIWLTIAVVKNETRSYGSSQSDLTVMKIDGKGKTIWHKIYGFKYYEYGDAVATTRDGGFMLVGGTNTLGKGNRSAYLLALDKRGELIWSHVYGGERKDVAHGVARMSDGSIIVVGETESFKPAKNFYIIKLKKQSKM